MANTSRNPCPARMYCSRMAPNSSWPAVSRTAETRRGEGRRVDQAPPAIPRHPWPGPSSAPHPLYPLSAALTVQSGRDAIHRADLRVGVFDGGVVVRDEVGLVGWGEGGRCYPTAPAGMTQLWSWGPPSGSPLSAPLFPTQCISVSPRPLGCVFPFLAFRPSLRRPQAPASEAPCTSLSFWCGVHLLRGADLLAVWR